MSANGWGIGATTRVFDFDDDLARSQTQANDPMWREIYVQWFPRFRSMEYVTDSDGQRSGTDRLVTLAGGDGGGTIVRIEEKIDYTSYNNFFLETWSDAKRRVPGWMGHPLDCDYIAYAFIQRRQCYFLPYQALRHAYYVNARRWIDAYKERKVANLCDGRSWITKGVPIPIQTLRQEIERGSYVEWTAEPQAGDMTILDDDEETAV